MFHLYITVILGKSIAQDLLSVWFLTLKTNAMIFPPFSSIRYWWTRHRWGWISAKALRGKVPKCELILVTFHHKMESRISECICLLAVLREPSCSSTLHESHCSKANSHLWVLLMHLQPELMLFLLRPRNTSQLWTCSLQAQDKFLACIAAQKEWRQIHHLCYWELMWAYSFELRWKEAYRYADLLCKENKWSQVQQPARPLNCSYFQPLWPSELLLFCRLFMYFKKQPSWACCPRRRW